MTWDPAQYHRFRQQREQPFADLLGLITIKPGLRVIDLGCGTGELTARLAAALPDSEVLGLDSSPQMLEQAHSLSRPGLAFQQQAIEDVSGEWDLVFSHAALQWVPDHSTLFPRLLSLVAPGGRLAVQMPANHEHPQQVLLQELALQEPFRSALSGYVRLPEVLALESYGEILHTAGGQDLRIRAEIYAHLLPDADAICEWSKGTVMLPYLERLAGGMQEAFVEAYRQRLREAFPGSPVYFGFKRYLLAASLPG